MARLTFLTIRQLLLSLETLIGLAAVLIAGLITSLINAVPGKFEWAGYSFSVLIFAPFLVFAMSIDQDDGTLRNKLIAGFSKQQYYLAQTVSAVCLSLVYLAVSFAPTLVFCESFLSGLSAAQLARALTALASGYAVTAAVCTFICLMISNKTAAVIIAFAVTAACAAAGREARLRLDERRQYWAASETELAVLVDNDRYIDAPARTALRLAAGASFAAQLYLTDDVIHMENMHKDWFFFLEHEQEHYSESVRDFKLIPVYSAGAFLLVCAAGCFAFGRKNIS